MSCYRKNLFLSKYNIHSFDVISFDIFDTLLFRLCHKPEDVFKFVGSKLMDFPYSPTMFQSLRIKAEQRARDKAKINGRFEILFEDIYDEMPFIYEIREQVMQKEIECEKQLLMLNKFVYDFLKYCYSKGKQIILISDMYFSKKQIEEFLIHTGVELNIIDHIFVSSEYNATKYSGDLYRIVIETIQNKKILHIGDNYQSDVINAKRNGIEAIHYSPINEDTYSIYKMESLFAEQTVDEIRSLRKLMSNENVYSTELEQVAYSVGTQVFGPVYSMYMEWVVELAIKNDIKKIVPLMREGKLFSHLLRLLCEKRNLNLEIEPIYISRKSSYLAQYSEITQQEILELMQRNHIQLNTVFDLLMIEIETTEFSQYGSYTIEQLKKIPFNFETLFDSIYKWLTSHEIIKCINEKLKEQRKFLTDYIQQITNGNNFLTVDLGFNGTMQKIITNLLPNSQKSYHALAIASDKVSDKILEGYRIYSWLGYAQENEYAIKSIYRSPEILEAVTNVSIGSTKEYEFDKDSNLIIPVLEKNNFPEQHIKFQKVCWQGIMDFQTEWIKISTHQLLKKLYLKRDGFRAILQRLIEYPTHKEAKYLGALIQHEYYHFTHEDSIVNDRTIKLLEDFGVEEFLKKTGKTFFPYKVYWPQGVVETIFPNYFVQKYIEKTLKTELEKEIYKLLSELATQDSEKYILIYGAGELGEKIYLMAKIMNITINAFIDRNYLQMPYGFHGLPVISIKEIPEKTTHIIIASLTYKNEILNTILELLAEEKRSGLKLLMLS